MAEQLTTEQVALLNNLMYMSKQSPLHKIVDAQEGTTIGEYLSTIGEIPETTEYACFMTGSDWNNIITAVRNDPELMNMEIAATHVDTTQTGGGGGESAVFVNPATNEAVVTFRGTGQNEWPDNFMGGGQTHSVDQVSTPYQENALEWYESLNLEEYSCVTVTGHSKGGNKAKYITLMNGDDTVDRCLSFDGQGFSDDFVDTYGLNISTRQHKITNNNVASDYVNILLNDVGETIFYEGYDYGSGSFLENHSPNTYFNFTSDGSGQFTMKTAQQNPDLIVVDEFLNSALRSMPEGQKETTLKLIGDLITTASCSDGINDILNVLAQEENVESASYLIAYLLKYKNENPQLVDVIDRVLNEMGLSDLTKVVDVVDEITQQNWFDEVLNLVGIFGLDLASDYGWLIRKLLEKYDIDLTQNELLQLVSVLVRVPDDMNSIKKLEDGKDLKVPSTNAIGGKICTFERERTLKYAESKCDCSGLQCREGY